MALLRYIPYAEFERLQALECSDAERARLFATLCRINVLYMIMRAGSGHIGSSLSCMDIVTWLYLYELRGQDAALNGQPRDRYFSSKGHDVPALYAVLAGLGRLPFDLLHSFRRLGGLPGHPDVSIPYLETNTGSLGMGISKAKGIIVANRFQNKAGNVFVLTGDGELQEGQIWESLPGATNNQMEELIVIVDHNKIQSDTWVSRVNDLGDLDKKFSSYGWAVRRCNGHDFQQLHDAISELRAIRSQPKVLIADTIKGQGVSFMAHTTMKADDRLYRYHSGAPSMDDYLKGSQELIESANQQLHMIHGGKLEVVEVQSPPKPSQSHCQRLVAAYSRALVHQAERHPHILVLDADLALDCGLLPFEERFPARFIECGIAEQDMVSQAGGMALQGLLPIVHSFACFLSARPNEQIYNNASEKKKIIYVGSLAGVIPGGPGHSHQAVRDIAALSAIPHLILLEPSCEAEVHAALEFCVSQCQESCYLRLVSVPCEISFSLPTDHRLEIGKGTILTEGRDAVVFAYGPILLEEIIRASAALYDQYGIRIRVINLPWLNRLDRAWLKEVIEDYRYIVTLDNHFRVGGQGEMITTALMEMGSGHVLKIKRFGLSDIPLCGNNQEVLEAHGLNSASLMQEIAEFLTN